MSKRKLLLADESVTVQKVVNLAFESEDIEIITANDGESAFEKFVEFTPDLVMADINLSGADGYEICRQIKQDEATKHIPVILLVGSFAPFSEEKAEKVGAEGFLKKPFQSIGLLINKVTDLLDMNEADDSEVGFNEADTQPMPAYEIPETSESASNYSISDDLGEAGMDDEMIETERGTDYSFVDETSKYETITEFDVDTIEDSGKTQPMTYDEIEELGLVNQEQDSAEEAVYELADEPDDYPSTTSFNFNRESDETIEETSANQPDSYEEYSAYGQTEDAQTENFPTTEEPTKLELDDFELLELPPLETTNEPISADYSETMETTSASDDSQEETAVESVQPQTGYSDHAETTAEDSYTMIPTEESAETQESYFVPAEESSMDFDSSETVEESPETAEFSENYYSPESQEAISATDFAEEKTETSIEPNVETQAMIAEATNQEISRTSDNKVVVHYLPPEVIDEIAERVVEKLAEKLRR